MDDIIGTVFNIQRFSTHDGPGIRTTVFLKGCNLHCFWCHNPESLIPVPQLQVFPEKCIGCGSCVDVCPVKAHLIEGETKVFKRDLCRHCGKCADSCYSGSLVLTGEKKNVSEIMQIVEQDSLYYENSKGGVTFSGGEPLLSDSFLIDLLKASRSRSFHTAVDTALNIDWSKIKKIIPFTDLFLVDFKHPDTVAHRHATGVDNTLILENLKKLSVEHDHIWIRIPIIPTFNVDIHVLEKMAEFLCSLDRIERVDLLPFHSLANGKYTSLGREYKASRLTVPSSEEMGNFRQLFRDYGLPVFPIEKTLMNSGD